MGHYAQECPLSFDIQTMSIEEKLELLPELLVLANMSKALETETKTETETVGMPKEEEEGFGAHSG